MCLQYKVKDMTQADFGRLEIEIAEAEMPGLIACRCAPPWLVLRTYAWL